MQTTNAIRSASISTSAAAFLSLGIKGSFGTKCTATVKKERIMRTCLPATGTNLEGGACYSRGCRTMNEYYMLTSSSGSNAFFELGQGLSYLPSLGNVSSHLPELRREMDRAALVSLLDSHLMCLSTELNRHPPPPPPPNAAPRVCVMMSKTWQHASDFHASSCLKNNEYPVD